MTLPETKAKGNAIIYGLSNVLASLMVVSSPCSSTLGAFFTIISIALLNLGIYLFQRVFPEAGTLVHDKAMHLHNSIKAAHAS
jgi:hypothetical protein